MAKAIDSIGEADIKELAAKEGKKRLLLKLNDNDQISDTFKTHDLLNALAFFGCLLWCLYSTDSAYHLGMAVYTAITLCAVLVYIVTGIISSREMNRSDSVKLACSWAGVIECMRILLLPLSFPLGRLLFSEEEAVTEEEILMMLDEGSENGTVETDERDMISSIFELDDTHVSDVMTHRMDVVAVSIDTQISDVVYTAINSGHSRIPVYSGSVDHIEGIINIKDLLCLIGMQSTEGLDVRSFMRNVIFVPESCMCDELFERFTAQKQQFAVVVDEYGGTAGVISMEDIIESVFGSIQDEYDNEEEDMTEISEGVYIIVGTADAQTVMEALGSPLPEDSEYDTIGGFITSRLGHIPADGETPTVTYNGITFTVLLAEDMRIERIKATVEKQMEESHAD
jgi:putative hemolysin